jgi:CelD/BcsL family acetyltransferase involved in cellulose biosynthesis
MTLLETMMRRDSLAAAPAAGKDWRVETTSDIDAVSRAWLSLEVSGTATPYQTLGWQRAALSALHPAARPLVITLRDRRGATLGLLPLVIANRSGVQVATFPGGKHANYNMGLFAPGTLDQFTAADLRAALSTAAKTCAIDLFAFRNQPREWGGMANPMALLPHQTAASGAWRAELMPDPDAFIASLMSSESRKKLRHKERKLAEIGTLAYVEAATPPEARELLDAFLAQKKTRFAAMGIANPFDEAEALAFLDQAAIRPLEGGPPAPLTLFALKVGDRVAAVFGGVMHGGRFSGMFTSFDGSSDIGRYSPGDLLILHLVRTMCARGLSSFDLGVGDAAYKSDYCRIREELFDSFLPMTLKGRAAANVLAAGYRMKTEVAKRKGMFGPLTRLLRR